MLGIGEHDKAVTPLMNAGQDLKNADAAAVLLRLLEKIKTTENEAQETDTKGIQINEAGTTEIPMHSNMINKNHETKIKGTVLLATLCVLAGSTGIGHYFRV